MNLYQTQTEFNGGIDLHTRDMYLCIMNRSGEILVHKKIRHNSVTYLEELIEPYKMDLTLCCESTVNWYFLHDFCEKRGIPFALGHALYIGAIAQSKHKNDRLDSRRLADQLRTNLLPIGYACPRQYREIRDLLRRRSTLIDKRSSLKTSLTTSTYMYGYVALTSTEKGPARRKDALKERVDSPLIEVGYDAFLGAIEEMDKQVKMIEIAAYKASKDMFPKQVQLLESVPGVGRTLALTILLETAELDRFPSVKDYASYGRLILPEGESSGKKCGTRNRKIGNKYLSWAFGQVAVHATRTNQSIRNYSDLLEKKRKKSSARALLAHRFCRAIFHMLKTGEQFDMTRFLVGKENMIHQN